MTARDSFASARRVIMGIVLFIFAAGANGEAMANPDEGRTYLDIEYAAMTEAADSSPLALRPFLRVENRFRDSGLVYEQWNVGFRSAVLSRISVAAYYTPRELLYPGKSNSWKNMYGADVIFRASTGPLRLLNRSANEWHVTDEFYRYRNLSEIRYTTRISWLSFYAHYEFRFDADQSRANMKNWGGGIEFDPLSVLTLRLFCDTEANRRSMPEWQYQHFAGLAIGGRF